MIDLNTPLTRNVLIFRNNQTAVYFASKDKSLNHDYIEPFLLSTWSIRFFVVFVYLIFTAYANVVTSNIWGKRRLTAQYVSVNKEICPCIRISKSMKRLLRFSILLGLRYFSILMFVNILTCCMKAIILVVNIVHFVCKCRITCTRTELKNQNGIIVVRITFS